MPAFKTLDQALAELAAVIGRLENAVDMRIEHQRQNSEIEGEVRVHEPFRPICGPSEIPVRRDR
jgi:hypothetical protein